MIRFLLLFLFFVSGMCAAQTVTPAPIQWSLSVGGAVVWTGSAPVGMYCANHFAGSVPQFVSNGPDTSFFCVSLSGGTNYGFFHYYSSCLDSETYPDYSSGLCKPLSTSPAIEELFGISLDDANTLIAAFLAFLATMWGFRQIGRALNEDSSAEER